MGAAILTTRKAATVIARQQAAASRRETMNTTPAGRRQAPAQLNAPLVSVGSGSGAHFDRCAYIIDLMQY